MIGGEFENALLANPPLVTDFGDPGRIRTQIGIAEAQVIVLEDRRGDEAGSARRVETNR